ncbi:MAG: hypothetical protein IT529_22640 [Burkholderiales bacterium]|nr:hypothetical protein [Burkholderiales bacterium]
MSREPGERRRAGAARLLVFRAVAIAAAAALAALVARYPPGAAIAGAALFAYAAALWVKPHLWLLAVPALLPVLDFSPWTGWFYVREGDFLVLATVAVGYWRLAPLAPQRRLAAGAAVLLALFAGATLASAYRGLEGLPAVDVNSFASYQTPYNAARVLVGYLGAFLLLPLLARAPAAPRDALRETFLPGMAVGLGLAAFAVLWERLAFPGLMDFSSEYRATGSFSDMHTGGAALDGYLVLALPFAAAIALQSRRTAAAAAAVLAFGLGTYGVLVTFTRSTYLAYGVALAVVLWFALSRARSGDRPGPARVVAALLALAIVSYVAVRVFATGGYRTLAAALGVFAGAFYAGAIDWRDRFRPMLAGAALLAAAVMVAAAAWVPKGAYAGYAGALGLFACGVLVHWRSDRYRRAGIAAALASLPLLCLGAVLIARHWGGHAALPDALLALAVAGCLVGLNRWAAPPLWRLGKASIVPAVLAAAALALFVPVASNAYVKSRFATLAQDFSERLLHWRGVVSMIDRDPGTAAFGMGLGAFPRAYFWRNPQGEIPGVQLYRRDGGNGLLRLGGPRYRLGYGEVLRAFQIVEFAPDGVYRLSLDARSNAKSRLVVILCEKWLIYPAGCTHERLDADVEAGAWRHYERKFVSRGLAVPHWFGARPVHLLLAVETARTYVEVDNVALLDAAGRNLVRNGGFDDGSAWWFFSSDHHHLPWHAKNLELHLLFEQGLAGLVLVAVLTMVAMWRYARRARDADPLAAAALAGLAGFLVVGLFDSLLDVTRLTLLFCVIVFLPLFEAVAPDGEREARAVPGAASASARRSR